MWADLGLSQLGLSQVHREGEEGCEQRQGRGELGVQTAVTARAGWEKRQRWDRVTPRFLAWGWGWAGRRTLVSYGGHNEVPQSVLNNGNVLCHNSRGQRSEIKISAAPCSHWRGSEMICPRPVPHLPVVFWSLTCRHITQISASSSQGISPVCVSWCDLLGFISNCLPNCQYLLILLDRSYAPWWEGLALFCFHYASNTWPFSIKLLWP